MDTTTSNKTLKCGIVMPISTIDSCSSDHWSEVLLIIKDSVIQAGFEPNLVSDADDSGIIQKRIIHNLYSNEIIVCDVSCKNPNVMFELGMRLAFDKPTIIIKDDKTDYSFDTSVIEHLCYPRDLRFTKIVTFKESLSKKIKSTYEKAVNDPNYTTFLKNFGEYKVAQLLEKEVSSEKYILSAIEDLRKEISLMRKSQNSINYLYPSSIKLKSEKKHENLKILIENLINDYINENKYTINDLAFNLEKKESIFNYLKSFDEVRNLCETPDTLREIINEIIDPF